MSGAVEDSRKACEWPDCKEAGTFRAPYSPDVLNRYRWFCKTHIREYNARWNYFQDHSAEELEAALESDKFWGRPTWSFKNGARSGGDEPHSEGFAWARFGYDDPFEVLGENATINRGAADPAGERRRRRLPPEDRRALTILGAEESVTKSELRRIYKSLVKDLHPDMNGGRRDDEDRLAEVVQAWEHLKQSRAIPD